MKGKLGFDLQLFAEMPKTKEEIVTALKGIEGGEEYVTALETLLSDSTKNTRAVKTLTTKVAEYETKVGEYETKIAALTESYDKIADFAGLPVEVEDIDAALEDLKKKKTASKEQGVDSAALMSQNNDLTRKVKRLEEEKINFEKLASDEKTKRQSMIRDIALQKALTENKAINPAITSKLLRDDVKTRDDDTLVYVMEDGTEVTVVEGVKSFLERCPDYLESRQNPGAGGGGGAPASLDFNNVPMSEYNEWRAKQN